VRQATSASGKHWIIAQPWPNLSELARRWGVSPIIAQLLLNRGLACDAGKEESRRFLAPTLSDLHPPEQLPGASQAADRIVQALRDRRRIVIYGDYDVDGTTGTAILWHLLRHAGADAAYYVPHRIEQGYGLSVEAVRSLVREGTGMIIAVDCGITALEPASVLAESGVDLIIADHHAPGEQLPCACAIVHPCLQGGYPNPELCGAGIAFKLAWLVALRLSGTGDNGRVSPAFRELLLHLLPLAALGTVADVVPLRGENRVIARHGLELLRRTPLPGLRALIEQSGLAGAHIDGLDAGFKLAPRVNAAGRMGHARLAVELFTEATPERAREIALYLEDHNRSRQSLERRTLDEAVNLIERRNLASDARRAIVLASSDWHPGVIGIVAARLVERYHRPAILIALSGDEGQGSGRSIRGFNLCEALGMCSLHLISHGGHAMAAGLRIAASNVEPFTQAFVEFANNRIAGSDLTSRLRLDAQVDMHDLSLQIVQTLVHQLGPFGVGNPKPRFATDWVTLAAEPRCVGSNGNHVQAVFSQNGRVMRAIAFRQAGWIEDLKQHRCCRLAFEPIISLYTSKPTVEMQVVDVCFPRLPTVMASSQSLERESSVGQ